MDIDIIHKYFGTLKYTITSHTCIGFTFLYSVHFINS